jgi:hypothetical protein
MLLGREYTSTVTFVIASVRTGGASQSLGDIAAQYGMTLPLTEVAPTSQYYAGLLQTRALLVRILEGRYPTLQDSATLGAFLGGRNGLPSEARALRRFRAALDVQVQPRTGLVETSVRLPDPVLAASVANALAESLAAFSGELRQAQGRERRLFYEAMLSDARQRLGAAEQALRDFYVQNRQWTSSPDLTYREGLLRRQVALSTDLYLSLNSAVEGARIDEVNTTPTLTVVDHAVPAVRRDSGALPWIAFGGLVSASAGAGLALLVAWLRRSADLGVPEAHRARAAVESVARALGFRLDR